MVQYQLVEKGARLTSEDVEFSANTANVRTLIWKYVVPAGEGIAIRNGADLKMKLQDAGGSELPNDTDIFFAFKKPADKQIYVFDTKLYRIFANLTIAEQADANTKRVRELHTRKNGKRVPGILFPENTEIHIEIKSSVVAAQANSWFEIEIDKYMIVA